MIKIITLVIPAHNEAGRIENAVDVAEEILSDYDYEIIVAEDGCVDDTPRIAEKLEDEGRIKHLHSDKKLGRGKSLERAFSSAEGDILLYMDADLATDPKHLHDLTDELYNGCDVVTGSRYLPESDCSRDNLRAILSDAHNFFTGLLADSNLKDHQCGFKGITREVANELLPLKNKHWFWDTELLVKAQRNGLKVKEIPVSWKENEENSKVRTGRDALELGIKVIALSIEMRVISRLQH